MEKIPKYTWDERLSYTKSRKWFCKIKRGKWMIPYVATDTNIFIDYIWRDLYVAKLKLKQKL